MVEGEKREATNHILLQTSKRDREQKKSYKNYYWIETHPTAAE